MRGMNGRAERLRQAVAGRYESAAAFSRALGVRSDSTVRSHLNGTRTIREETARRYAAKLGVSWLWLMYGDDKEAPASLAGADAAIYTLARDRVREVFAAAGLDDDELEAKTVAELYHSIKSKRQA